MTLVALRDPYIHSVSTGRACALAAALAILSCAGGALLERGSNPVLSVVTTRHAVTQHPKAAPAPVQPPSVSVSGIVRAYDSSTGLLSIDNGGEQYKLRAPGSFTFANGCGLEVGQKIVATVTAYMSGTLVVQSIRLDEPISSSTC